MQEPGRGHERWSGSGMGRRLGHDRSIGAWIWHGTGTREGERGLKPERVQ